MGGRGVYAAAWAFSRARVAAETPNLAAAAKKRNGAANGGAKNWARARPHPRIRRRRQFPWISRRQMGPIRARLSPQPILRPRDNGAPYFRDKNTWVDNNFAASANNPISPINPFDENPILIWIPPRECLSIGFNILYIINPSIGDLGKSGRNLGLGLYLARANAWIRGRASWPPLPKNGLYFI
jgi:hypothetical protein